MRTTVPMRTSGYGRSPTESSFLSQIRHFRSGIRLALCTSMNEPTEQPHSFDRCSHRFLEEYGAEAVTAFLQQKPGSVTVTTITRSSAPFTCGSPISFSWQRCPRAQEES